MRIGCLTILLTSLLARSASATPETGPARVRLPTGTTIFGVVTELVPGEYLIIQLPHGELRTYAWDEIDLVHVRGGIAIGPRALPPDPRPWSERTAPASVSPTTSIGSDNWSESASTSSASNAGVGWALGARGTVMSPTGQTAMHGLGFGGEGNLTHWLSPELGFYGLFEHVRFQSAPLGPSARTTMLGAGIRISSSGTTAALLDVATGYRLLSLQGEGWAHRGAIPLRIGVGVRLRPTRASDVDLLVHVAPHLVGYANEPLRCDAVCGPLVSGPVGFVGVSLGMGLGL